MENKFIYSQDKKTIEFLKQKFEVLFEDNDGCYFLNDISNVDFDLSNMNKSIIYTNSIDVELD